MLKMLDLKLQIIQEEIENALDTYSDPVYKAAFAIPELRQKLLSYVLNNVPGYYIVIEDTQNFLIKHYFSYRSLELRLDLETHIHNGIHHIFEENHI